MRAEKKPWMVATVHYTKTDENGNDKRVSEKVALSADTFSEAENAILKEYADYANVDLDITGMARPAFKEIFFSDNDKDDKLYTAKLCFVTIDIDTGKEKKSKDIYLVQAATIAGAVKNIDEVMKPTMSDYTSISVTESGIANVLYGE